MGHRKEKYLGPLLRLRFVDGVLTDAMIRDLRVDGIELKFIRKMVYLNHFKYIIYVRKMVASLFPDYIVGIYIMSH